MARASNKPIDRSSQLYKTQRKQFLDQCRTNNTPCTGWPGSCGQPIDYNAAPQTSQAFELCHIVPVSIRADLAYVRANWAAGHCACNRSARDKQTHQQHVRVDKWVRPTWIT